MFEIETFLALDCIVNKEYSQGSGAYLKKYL